MGGTLEQLHTQKIKEAQQRAEESLRDCNRDVPLARGYTEVPFDREQAFLLYASFSGDVTRTAHALGTSAEVILKIAEESEWQSRLAAVLKLRSCGRPGDVERAINRATNFAQAHRARLFLERLITKIYRLTDSELEAYCFVTETHKRKDKATGEIDESVEHHISTRPFADLASAMEKIHNLTYAALMDTTAERKARAEREASEDQTPTKDIHAAISAAVAAAQGDGGPRAQLFEGQLEQVRNLAAEHVIIQEQKAAGTRDDLAIHPLHPLAT
jgi:hypothetical protein